MPSKLSAALDWAAHGFYVFPCTPGDKRPPLTPHGHKDATRDKDRIRLWWTMQPAANVAISPAPSGLMVLDIDAHSGGYETLQSLIHEHGPLPETFTVSTPRGGKHYWFRGTVPSTIAKLGPGIDTKSEGGYVLGPPSEVDGKSYTIHSSAAIAPLPEWISDRGAKLSSRPPSAVKPSRAEIDLAINVERARARLQAYAVYGDVAIEGQGGDATTYRVAAGLLDLGLSEATVVELMDELWNPSCQPPWTAEELARKVANAAQYRQNELGCLAFQPSEEVFSHFAESASEAEKPARPSRFRPIPAKDFHSAFLPPEWLIPDLIPKGGTVQFSGPPAQFKSFLALDLALGIAAGVETFGHSPSPAPTVYIAGEAPAVLALKHVPAWRLARGVEGDIPFWIVPSMPQASESAEIRETADEIAKAGIAPALVVIDTATRALRGLDENSARDMSLFSAACEYLQHTLRCTVLVIRHSGKDVSRGSRGSNVLEGDFDTIAEIKRHEKTTLVQLRVTKQRSAAEREEPFCFEGRPSGASLAFHPIPSTEFAKEIATEDEFSQARIAGALRDLGGGAVSTDVLASELGKSEPETAKPRIVRALRALAKTDLRAWCETAGKSLTWRSPPEYRSSSP